MPESAKNLAVELTNGDRHELALASSAFLFLRDKGAAKGVEPVLLGDSETIEVSDSTQELSAENQTIHFRTAHASSVATLEDGLFLGQRLSVKCESLGTGGDTLTLTSATGIEDAGGSALTSIDFDAADEFVILDWIGDAWRVVYATATETA